MALDLICNLQNHERCILLGFTTFWHRLILMELNFHIGNINMIWRNFLVNLVLSHT